MSKRVIYFHRRNDTNEVFYVGIGDLKNRPYQSNGRNNEWTNVFNTVGRTVEIVHEGLTWDEACEYEMKYIKDFGRKDKGLGQLVNKTDGGDGTMGYKPTKEVKEFWGWLRQGERGSGSKKTEDEILEIRRLYATKKYTQKQLSKMFNIIQPTISQIVRRKTWKHI